MSYIWFVKCYKLLKKKNNVVHYNDAHKLVTVVTTLTFFSNFLLNIIFFFAILVKSYSRIVSPSTLFQHSFSRSLK